MTQTPMETEQIGADVARPVFAPHHRSNWVRLRTLVILRWCALTGQLVAVETAQRLLDLSLPLGPIYGLIALLAITNLVAQFVYPANRRLTEAETTTIMTFDVAQLGLLVGLTGGLDNPFALLILAPVTITATALGLRATLGTGGLALLAVTANLFFHVPLTTIDGLELSMPPLFTVGFWAALVIGIVFQAVYSQRVTSEVAAMNDALVATQMALAREQKLTDLGGVVAAAAHELGTPLSTISLAGTEMMEATKPGTDLYADALLIRQQADRCRDILRSMGRVGKDDLHMRRAPLTAVVQEAAEPHLDRGKEVIFAWLEDEELAVNQPVILRRPEIIHGVRNLIQNAVDYAAMRVWVDLDWTAQTITLRIQDDGPGFAADLLPRLGDPYLRRRRGIGIDAPKYEGMGLGLFIAKTLLERSGAEISFANAADTTSRSDAARHRGALVVVTWPHDAIAADPEGSRAALGENSPLRG